jgi:hypothetical protein
MEATLLNSDLEVIGFLDVFKSFLWTDKYQEFGEFEIVEFPNNMILSSLSNTKYICIKESEHIMVLESIRIKTDPLNGNELFIKGRSLESILYYRIVWDPIVLDGSLQDGIETILNDNAINPTDTDRKINKLEFLASTDPAITALTVKIELLGEYLYDVISSLCISYGIGFKIVLTDLGKFSFQLYVGADRSYNQSTNPYVVFSPNFDNLLNGDYWISTENLKTNALIGGEKGVGNIRTFTSVEYPSDLTDLNRREIFVDAQSITRTGYGEEESLSDSDYSLVLEEEGYNKLSENQTVETFEGQLESSTIYIYGQDFFMGDIVQVANEYGHEANSRVSEMVYFQDSSEIKMVPTFSKI